MASPRAPHIDVFWHGVAVSLGGQMKGSGVRFGEVVFDPARRRLSVSGRSVALDRSSAEILKVLVGEAANEVDKDRLLEAGWPGRLVHENSLATAVSRLRQALGDQSDLLETVHGYGYRLAAEPEEVAVARSGHSWRSGLRWSLFALPAAALSALAVVWLAGHADALFGRRDAGLLKGEPANSIGRVLWVDDHPQNNASERAFLERNLIAVYQVVTTEEALQLLAMYEYDAVISDMNRNDKPLDGITLVKAMRQRKDPTPFFLYTVVPSQAQQRIVAEAGGQAATVTPQQLYSAVVPLIRKSKTARSRA
jgi:DNA-binding response OmpR family regulator